MLDLALEVAHTLEARGGGLGAVQRTVLSGEDDELELTLRYYARGFANPYARPVAAADEFEGLRARNEAGARLRLLHRTPEVWRLQAQVDVWALPEDGATPGSAGTAHLQAHARLEALLVPDLVPSLLVEHRNKDLSDNGPGLCFEGQEDCSGEQYRLGGRLRWEPLEDLVLAAQYQHTWAGSRQHPEGFVTQGRTTVEVAGRLGDSLRLQGRASWLADGTSPGAVAVRGSLDMTWAASRAVSLHGRYELELALGEPADSRSAPEPSSHRLRLDVEARF
jgi:hypothetical protein